MSTNHTHNKTDAETFLGVLFDGAQPGELIDLRRIHPGKPALEEFVPVAEIAVAATWAQARRGKGDVYVGVLPRGRRAGGRDAISAGRAVWVDCDTPEAVAALAEFALEPSMAILSGSGANRHVYWLLDEPVVVDVIESINRRLASRLGGDRRACDGARILRVPGTLNHKHEPPTDVTAAVLTDTRYTLAQIEAALGDRGAETPVAQPVDDPPPDVDGPTGRVLSLLDIASETGRGWTARCPAHDDERPSLSVAEGADGRCLLHCFAGCKLEDIVAALGLQMEDLFAPDDDGHSHQSLAELLVGIATLAGVRLFHDSGHRAYAWVPVGDHQEVWPVDSRRFERWLRIELHRQHKRLAKREAVNEAVAMLSATADFDAPAAEVHLRTAWNDDGFVYDLADDDGQAVIVTQSGWRIETQSEIPFLRRDSTLALPVPSRGGGIGLLRPFVNVGSDMDFMLVISWLVMALRPDGPYPVLVIVGPQGSAKSTQTRMLKLLVDQVKAPLRSLPNSLQNLAIAARGNHVLAFDNVSRLTDMMSDGFCRLATGDGFATRELYSNDEEVIFEHTRVVILNGIDAIVTRQDLLGRAIVVRLTPVEPEARMDEDTLWSRFERDRGAIFGALLDGAVSARANWEATRPEGFRMADFARWAAGAMPAFGWTAEEFVAAYRENLSGALKASLEGSILATVVMRLVLRPLPAIIEGTPTAVHKQLYAKLTDDESKGAGFPKNAQTMSHQLTLLSPALAEVGVSVEITHRGSGSQKARWIVIKAEGERGTDGTDGGGARAAK